jgi:hypothetical protein
MRGRKTMDTIKGKNKVWDTRSETRGKPQNMVANAISTAAADGQRTILPLKYDVNTATWT